MGQGGERHFLMQLTIQYQGEEQRATGSTEGTRSLCPRGLERNHTINNTGIRSLKNSNISTQQGMAFQTHLTVEAKEDAGE